MSIETSTAKEASRREEDHSLDIRLEQNFPNSFTDGTTIRFSIPYACEVRLVIADIQEQELITLHHGHLYAGTYNINWGGTDSEGKSLPSSMYIYFLEASCLKLARLMEISRG